MKTRTLNNLFLVNLFSIFYVSFVESTACPANEYTSQTQKYKIEFEIDATWKYSDFAAYTQAPMLDRASSMLTKEELFDFLDNSGQTTFPVVGADEWTTVIDYENGDPPSYVRWYQVGTAGGSGYKSMSSWKTYSEGGSTGITALETNYDWLGYNFRWQETTCDGGGVSCHSKVVLLCQSCPAGMTSPAGSTSLDACLCQSGSFKAPITLPGLNALYLFDSDTRDSSGNGYDLTMTNGAADPYSFLGANGVDPSLKIKDETTLLTRTATVASQNLLNNIVNGKPVGTLAVWVKDIRFVDGNDHQYGILGLNWADGKWFRLDVYASGKLVFVLYAGAWGTTSMFPECQNSPDWTRGGWWHIVFTSDGTNVGMQYRSAADASYTSCTLLSEQSGNPVISTWTATGSVSASSIETFTINVFNVLNPGTLIDEVRVYNRVLSSEEILQVFDEKNNVCKSCGAGLTTLAPGAVSADACVCSVGSFKTDAYDTHLIAHYGFDGDTRDLQNPGNVATLTGNGGIASLDTTHKISGSHSVKLTNDDGLKTFVLLPQFELDTSLTISLWFRWDVTSLHDSGYTKLFYFSGDLKLYASGDSSVSGDGEALYFVMYDQNNNRIEYKNSDRFYFSNNVWYHVSWVVNKNSEMRVFVDGEYVPRTNTDKLESGKFPLWGASANMNNNRIGTHASHDDGRDSIDGHVEEIRLYNTALPDSAVKALYEARGAPCMSCSSGLTTLAPGANSSDACACQAGSYSPFSDAVVAFNPANELFGSARSESLGSLDFNIASLGFTVVTKFNMKSASVVNYNRIFDFGGKDGVSVDKTKPNYNIILFRGGDTQNLYFSIWKSSGVWTGGCELIVPFQFDTWHQVSARYHPSDGVYLTIDDSPVVHDGSENCKNQPDRTLTTNLIADSWWSADSQSDIEIAGVYAFNRYLSDAEAQAVLDMIKVEGLDDPCANCPTDSPYTDPSHGATSADECQAPAGNCDTITVTSDRKIIYEKRIHQDLGDADANWAGYFSWVSVHAGYTIPTVSQMNEFVGTAEFADLKTASQIDPGGDHALTTDEWTPVYADDGITRKWYQVGLNGPSAHKTVVSFDQNTGTTYTGWYFATFFPSDVTSSMVKVVSFYNSPSPYTLTFSAATTADVLVVSGSNYQYTTNIPVSAEFTVTVGADGSALTDAAGNELAGIMTQNLVRKCGVNEDQPCGVIGKNAPHTGHEFACIVSDCAVCSTCTHSGWHGGSGLDEWARIDLGKTFVVTKISIRPPKHGGVYSYAERVDGIQVHIGDTDSVSGNDYTANNPVCGQVQVDWGGASGTSPNIENEGPFVVECNMEGRYVDLRWLENDGVWKQAGPVAVFGYEPGAGVYNLLNDGVSSGLVAHWKFDGHTVCASGESGDCLNPYVKVFDGYCQNSESDRVLVYSGSDNPGTTEAERVKACSEACLRRKTGLTSGVTTTWVNKDLQTFFVKPSDGRCWCQTLPSSCSDTMTLQHTGYDTYDWIGDKHCCLINSGVQGFADATGNYPLTMSGTTFESPTQFGQGVKFTADTNFVHTTTPLVLKPGTLGLTDDTPVTFSMWVKRTRTFANSPAQRDFIFAFGEAANNKMLGACFMEGNTLEYFSYGPVGLKTTQQFTDTASWIFFTFTRSAGVQNERRIYMNGGLLTSDIDTVTLAGPGDMSIGRMYQSGVAANAYNQASRNIIDDFRVYSRVLTDAEITALYQAGTVSDITGETQAYARPQVILRYKSEVCGPSCPAGSSLPSGSSSLDACACDANLHSDLSPIYDGRPPISAWSYSQLSSEAACNTPLHFGIHGGVDTSGTAGSGKTACFETVDSNNYLQLDMSTEVIVTGIQTMGRASDAEYITLYQIKVSKDGATWTNAPCAEVNGSGFCVGNSDAGSVKQNDLASKVVARYVKLIVKGYSGHESLRMSVLAQTCVSCPNVAWQHYVPT